MTWQEPSFPTTKTTNLMKDVSIVLPAYNEADNIETTVSAWTAVVKNLEISAEIIVVNDGSSDATAQVLESMRTGNPLLKVCTHSVNKGYGSALVSGFVAAQSTWTFFTDSDGQFNPEDFVRLWKRRAEADLILGYREHRSDPPFRKLNAWLWGQYVRRVFCVDVRDLNCAFKLFPTQVLQSFSLQSQGAFINAELLSLFRQQQCDWIEVPVRHFPRVNGAQTGANPRVVLSAFRESLSFWKERHRRETSL